MEQVDARGQACPLPVVRAKKALAAMGAGQLEVLVDNETAVHNLEALGRALKVATATETRGENEFAVVFDQQAPTAGSEPAASADPTACAAAAITSAPAGDKVVVLSGEHMGQGDDALGATLMKAFVFALTQQDELPATILAYNGGVKLTVEGSPVLDDLKKLAAEGVEILSCGTCLNHYGLTEQLAVGDVTNMYVIAQKQLDARVVVRP